MLHLLNIKHVVERVSICKTTIYALIKEDKFPRPVRISQRRVGWLASDVDDFLASLKTTGTK